MTKTNGKVCGDCSHLKERLEKSGLCYRYPPTASMAGFVIRPRVGVHDKPCGEFDPVDKPEPTVAEIKGYAAEVSRAALDAGLMRVTGTPATGKPPPNKKG